MSVILLVDPQLTFFSLLPFFTRRFIGHSLLRRLLSPNCHVHEIRKHEHQMTWNAPGFFKASCFAFCPPVDKVSYCDNFLPMQSLPLVSSISCLALSFSNSAFRRQVAAAFSALLRSNIVWPIGGLVRQG